MQLGARCGGVASHESPWRRRHQRTIFTAQGFVKVVFELEQDAEGWPPIRYEGLWATPTDEHVYAIDNVPFYAYVAVGDRVRAVDVAGELRVVAVTHSSGHGTLRVLPCSEDELVSIRSFAKECGCESERSDEMVAIDLPPGADWPRLQQERCLLIVEALRRMPRGKKLRSPRGERKHAPHTGNRARSCERSRSTLTSREKPV